MPYPLPQRLPPSSDLAEAWLDTGARHLPEDGRHLRRRGAPLFELGTHMPRDEAVESCMHVDGDGHEGEAPLVRSAQRTVQSGHDLHRLESRPKKHHTRVENTRFMRNTR